MSCCTTTVPNSVRNSAPVGQTSRQPACVQCLHTSEAISQRNAVRPSAPCPSPGLLNAGMPRSSTGETRTAASCAVGSGLVPSSPPPRSAPRSSGVTTSAESPVPVRPGRQPGQAGVLAAGRPRLLDEGDVPPRVRAQRAGVVERHAEQVEPVFRHGVPRLAGHLAGLAADAHRGVGEEADAFRVVAGVPGVAGRIGQRAGQAVAALHDVSSLRDGSTWSCGAALTPADGPCAGWAASST